MRLLVIATAACAALLAAPAVAAPRAATLNDPKGDWPVAGQDVLSARVTSVRVAGRPALVGALSLSAAPDAPTQYSVAVAAGCDSWLLSVRGLGTDLQDARIEHLACSGLAEYATRQAEVADATAVVRGNTVEITAPYALGLRRGVKVTSMSAGAAAFFTGVYVGHGVGDEGFVMSGDVAFGKASYVLP
jgi:hypothetical protein